MTRDEDVTRTSETSDEGSEAEGTQNEDTQQAKMKIMSGGFVDERLTLAFDRLQDLSSFTPDAAITDRCWELLCHKTDILEDLSWLVKHMGDDQHPFSRLRAFYTDAIGRYKETGGKLPVTSAHQKFRPSFGKKLIKTYTMYKKLILWDVLLGLRRSTPPPSPADRIDSYAPVK